VLTTGGSSSGVGTSVSFWAANVGTETSGSILSPSNQTMLVGIKPTVGRISRYGIIPITADQDTAGPMARTVADAALLLGVLEGKSADSHDAATRACPRVANGDYTRYLNPRALEGARIGIPRADLVDETLHGSTVAEAAAVLRKLGATVVDPADLPEQPLPVCRDNTGVRGKDTNCSIVFKYGMKRDFNAWLASLGPKAPVKTLTQLREWNVAHRDEGAIKYGQGQLDNSDSVDLEADRARYVADRQKDIRVTAAEGIDLVLKRDHLDALIFPGSIGSVIAAKPGYPTVIVPFGFVPNAPSPPFPSGFDARPSPLGISFTGTACSEPRLIELAYAFEQATKRRVPPSEFP
jgi:amidase